MTLGVPNEPLLGERTLRPTVGRIAALRQRCTNGAQKDCADHGSKGISSSPSDCGEYIAGSVVTARSAANLFETVAATVRLVESPAVRPTAESTLQVVRSGSPSTARNQLLPPARLTARFSLAAYAAARQVMVLLLTIRSIARPWNVRNSAVRETAAVTMRTMRIPATPILRV